MKKGLAIVVSVALWMSVFSIHVSACNESQSETYVCQVLFGDSAYSYSSNEKVKMLMAALYLCCEQYDNNGEDKLAFLKSHKVPHVPALSSISLPLNNLLQCAHSTWTFEHSYYKDVQRSRRQLLRNTVTEVFDNGFTSKLFGRHDEKYESFAALLYYTHILADYLGDDPIETENNIDGSFVPSYSGETSCVINGNQPNFTQSQKSIRDSYVLYGQLNNGKAGTVIACIGPDSLATNETRKGMSDLKPSGWSNDRYFGVVNSSPPYIYNRCHLLAHSLGGDEIRENMVTGTRYMNDPGMTKYEKEVSDYVKATGNHVLYRVTPRFKGENLLVSGVQIEAFSLEDFGQGICFNVYCYNVQPGININYHTGANNLGDILSDSDKVIPFALYVQSGDHVDLMSEIDGCLRILFKDQADSSNYRSLLDGLNAVAIKARLVDPKYNPANSYAELKGYEYEYLEILKTYVPLLLQKEAFFSVF